MPSEPVTIVAPIIAGPVVTYRLPSGVAQYVQAVYAEVDTSGSGDVRPTLRIAERSGQVIAAKRQGEAIPGGGAGTATWALRLDDEQNLDAFLRWGANTDPAGAGLTLTGIGGGWSFDTGGGGFATQTGGGGYSIDTTGGGGSGGYSVTTGGGGIDFDTGGGGYTIAVGSGLYALGLNSLIYAGATDALQLNPTTLGFFGHAPIARPAHPVTLADVISVLTNYGLVNP